MIGRLFCSTSAFIHTCPTIDANLGVGKVGGVKQLLLICAVLALVEWGEKKHKPLTKEGSARHAKVIEAAIRDATGMPTGELTKADLEKVTKLYLHINKLTDVKGLEKLTQLEVLFLGDNPALTKAHIDELKKALPKCDIQHNATK